MKLMKLRAKVKRKKPNFKRQNAKNLKRLGDKWRKPKGRQSKLRRHMKGRGFLPNPGYCSPRAVRYLHPSGYEEVLVSNLAQLDAVNASEQCIRIAASVGKKKRIEMQKKAEEMKIKILNPKKIELKIKGVQ